MPNQARFEGKGTVKPGSGSIRIKGLWQTLKPTGTIYVLDFLCQILAFPFDLVSTLSPLLLPG